MPAFVPLQVGEQACFAQFVVCFPLDSRHVLGRVNFLDEAYQFSLLFEVLQKGAVGLIGHGSIP